jgi:mRNA interferase RelE/StbE
MYDIILSKDAQKFVAKQDATTKRRLKAALLELAEDPFTNRSVKRLRGTHDLLRLRVGTYRIVFSVEDDRMTIMVIDIDNRGDVYKRI